jgi:hypothetical protein
MLQELPTVSMPCLALGLAFYRDAENVDLRGIMLSGVAETCGASRTG